MRHAYFTGADEPYEKPKWALRAEVDEAAWASLYSTTSRAFERPKPGKIAVKVISLSKPIPRVAAFEASQANDVRRAPAERQQLVRKTLQSPSY